MYISAASLADQTVTNSVQKAMKSCMHVCPAQVPEGTQMGMTREVVQEHSWGSRTTTRVAGRGPQELYFTISTPESTESTRAPSSGAPGGIQTEADVRETVQRVSTPVCVIAGLC